jgi:hypothetical protein
MSNASSRAERYRDSAEECRRLAATSFSTQLRKRYSQMAENYTTLAEAEVTRHTTLRQLTARVMLAEMP